MKKKKTVFLVKDVLNDVMHTLSTGSLQDQQQLEDLWAKVVGRDRGHAACVGIKEGTLFVTVDSPARLFYMRMKQQTLLTQLKKERSDIQKIIFKIGKIR